MRSRYAVGVVFGALAAICYGTNPLGAVFLHRAGFETGNILMFRFGMGALLLGACMLLRRRSFALTRRDFFVTLALGALFAASSLTYYACFWIMDIGVACTLLYAYPIMTAVLMAVFFGEKLRLRVVASTLLALLGIAILSLGDGGRNRLTAYGTVLVLISALTYALYIILVNRAKLAMPAGTMTFWVVFFCFLFLTAGVAAVSGPSALHLPATAGQWGHAAFLGVVPTFLSLVFLTLCIDRVGATPAAVLGALEPLTAAAIGIWVFGEAFTLHFALGLGIVLFAVMLIVKKK